MSPPASPTGVEAIDRTIDEMTERIRSYRPDLEKNFSWMENQFLEETIHFFREGRYRAVDVAAVEKNVYSNTDYMLRYLDGIVFSYSRWPNHRRAAKELATRIALSGVSELTEVGPGPGFLSQLLLKTVPGLRRIRTYDISHTSVHYQQSLVRLCGQSVEIHHGDFFESPPGTQALLLSDILEHFANPEAFMKKASNWLLPGGRLFVNFPINSPAPDHVFLLRSPQEVEDLVRSSGYRVLSTALFPEKDYPLEKARRLNAAISVVLSAEKIP